LLSNTSNEAFLKLGGPNNEIASFENPNCSFGIPIILKSNLLLLFLSIYILTQYVPSSTITTFEKLPFLTFSFKAYVILFFDSSPELKSNELL